MKRAAFLGKLWPVYAVVLVGAVLLAMAGSKAVTVMGGDMADSRRCIIIDAGHGGEDGGASAHNGVYESNINLQIALKLQDLLHLLGIKTKMIRSEDISIYTEGSTIAAKKVSDLKERVRIVNSTENAMLISIHQNHYAESKYSGAQVFYADTDGSKALAKQLQGALVATVNPGSNRQCKRAEGIYLMQRVQCTAVLVECGFLSNPAESAELQTDDYQRKLCGVIASVCSQYLAQGADFA